jgi:hypothetical protein
MNGIVPILTHGLTVLACPANQNGPWGPCHCVTQHTVIIAARMWRAACSLAVNQGAWCSGGG